MMKTLFILLLTVGCSLQNPLSIEEENNSDFGDSDIIKKPVDSSLNLQQLSQKRNYIGIYFKANWFKAAQFCAYTGMRLATIKSQKEQDLLDEQIKELGMVNEYFWTSGTDKAKEGSFFWMSNGKPFTYTNWLPNEPNNIRFPNGETEDCVSLENENGKGFKWNDRFCSEEHFFICEYSSLNSTQS